MPSTTPGSVSASPAAELRDAEVGDLHAAAGREQHVARLHVAVHHAVVVRVGERVGDLRADGGDLGRGKRAPLLELGPQAAAVDELHHDERLGAAAPVVDADHVGVVQARRGPGLALEPLRRAGVIVVVGTFTATGRSSRWSRAR